MKGTHVDDVVGFGDGIEGPAVDLVATAHDVDFIAFGNRVRPHGLDHRVIGRILARWLDGVMCHPFSVPGQARRWSIRAVEDVHMKQFAGVLIWFYWRVLGMPMYWFHGFMAVGGNFAAKKSALEKIGGFDTSIEFYGEDTNIARRLADAGKVRFSLSLPMYTSPRRFRGDGLLRTAWNYGKNFLSEAFLRKPVTSEYTDIR